MLHPTMMLGGNAADQVIALTHAIATYTSPDGGRMLPVLVGRTGTGKTARIETLASTLNLPLERVLLGTELPEDVLGLPRIVDEHGTLRCERVVATRWRRAAEQPTLILLDELDKARPDTHAALLTLTWSRTIDDVTLHDDTIIVGAMQPVGDEFLANPTGEALAARAVWIPVAPDWGYVTRHAGLPVPLTDILALDSEPPPIPTLPQPSPRQVAWWITFATTHPEHAEAAAHGMFPTNIATILCETVTNPSIVAHSATRLIREGRTSEVIHTAPIPVLLWLAGEIAEHGTADDLADTWARIDTEAGPDELSALIQAIYHHVEASGGSMLGLRADPRPQDEIIQVLRRRIEEHVAIRRWEEERRAQ